MPTETNETRRPQPAAQPLKIEPAAPAAPASPAKPVLGYRAEAEDTRPANAPNVLAGAVCVLLILPCVAAAAAIFIGTVRGEFDADKWPLALVAVLAALGGAACCVVAARHHFGRRPSGPREEPPGERT